jgi:hypothetical protein
MGEFFTELILLKFPGDRVTAIIDEYLLKELGITDQVFLQQPYLFLEQIDRSTLLQFSDFFLVALYMMPVVFYLEISLQVTLDILRVIAFITVGLFFITL